jgi:hypothetical protein
MNLGASFFGEGTSGPSPTGPLPGGCGSAHWLTSQITSMGGYRPHGGPRTRLEVCPLVYSMSVLKLGRWRAAAASILPTEHPAGLCQLALGCLLVAAPSS